MKKKITLNPIIAVVLVLLIVIATAGLTRQYDTRYWFDIKTVKDHFNKQFQGEFLGVVDFFCRTYETTAEHDKVVYLSEVSAHSYFCMSVFPQTSYADNFELNELVVAIEGLIKLGDVFEAADGEIAMDMLELSHDLNNRELAQEIKE